MKSNKDVIVLLVVIINFFVSMYVFSSGFLLTRNALSHVNTKRYSEFQRFDKAVILLVDALRYDFAFSSDNSSVFGLKTVESLLKNHPENSKIYKFIADPPTTTMQRIKGLMSGTLPTFIDAGANFNSYKIEEDNLIHQSASNNKSVVIMGDDTWLSLFDESLFSQINAYPSFDVKDLDTVDLNVRKHLLPKLKLSDWNVIVAHFLGVDHVGHTYGAKNPIMKRKLKFIDDIINEVSAKIDDNTLLVLISDHGMTNSGDHGGDSHMEVEALLFFYAKQRLFSLNSTTASVRQIDLVPTLSLLLGLPIPFSNLGIIISDIFHDKQFQALKVNYEQIRSFKHAYKIEDDGVVEDDEIYKDATSLLKHLIDTQEMFREKWSNFNIKYCLIGIVSFSLNCLFILSIFSTQNSFLSFIGVLVFFISLAFAGFIFKISLQITASIYCIFANIVSFFTFARNFSSFSKTFKKIFFHLEFIIYAISLFIPFSNSFVVNESNCLKFLASVSITISVLKSTLQAKKLLSLIFMLFLCRLGELFYACREEVPTCIRTIFSASFEKFSFEPHHSLFQQIFIKLGCLLLSVSALIYFYQTKIKPFFKNSDIYRLISLVQILLISLYWILNFLHSIFGEKLFFSIYIPRAFYLVTIFGILNGYFRNFGSKQREPQNKILAYLSLLAILLLGENRAISLIIFYEIMDLLLNIGRYSNKLDKSDKRVSAFLLTTTVLEQYFFYASGHETTFTSIRWEAVFHGFDGDSNNMLIRLLFVFFLILSTYFARILSIIKSFKDHANQNYENLAEFSLVYLLIISLKLLCCMIAAFVLRRHLMVWKIFAPRLLYEFVAFTIGALVIFLMSQQKQTLSNPSTKIK